MTKSCATFIALGLTIGVAGWVMLDMQDMLAEAIRVGLAQPATPNVVRSDPGDAARLVQIAENLNISHERLQALAQDAASEGDLGDCIEVMIAVWGPAGAEEAVREIELASNG